VKIVIAGTFPPGAIELFLELLPQDWHIDVITDEANLRKRTDIEVLITRAFQITEEIILHNPDLKFIQKWGTGLNAVDVEAAGRRGIPVCNVPGANAYAVSELAVLHMLAVYRNLLYHNRKLVAGVWTKSDRIEDTYCLNKKTVGLIGGGNIGRLVAQKVRAFGATVQYYDIYRLSPALEEEYEMCYVSLEELLCSSDVVSLHIPLNDQTKNFIDYDKLKRMKPTSILINTSRGGLINENDLLQALDENLILGAGLDCLCHEKDSLDSKDPILHHDRLTLTPHIGGTSNDLLGEMVPRMAANAIRFVRGEEPKSIANREYLIH
jgi:phosphoglycerate dehydrogenase-like enzyme